MKKEGNQGLKNVTHKKAVSLLDKLDKIIAEKSVERCNKEGSKMKDRCNYSIESRSSRESNQFNRTLPLSPDKLRVKFNEKPLHNNTARNSESKEHRKELDKLKKIVTGTFSKTMVATKVSGVKHRIVDLSIGSNKSDSQTKNKTVFAKTSAHGLKNLAKASKDKSRDKSPLGGRSFYMPKKSVASKTGTRLNNTTRLSSAHQSSMRDNSLSVDKSRAERSKRMPGLPKEAIKATPNPLQMPIKKVKVQPVPLQDYRFKVELRTTSKTPVTSKSPATTRGERPKRSMQTTVLPTHTARIEQIQRATKGKKPSPSKSPKITKIEKAKPVNTRDSSGNNISSYQDKSVIPQVSTNCRLPSVNSSVDHSDFIHLETFNQSECGDELIEIECLDTSQAKFGDQREVEERHIIQQKIAMLLEREKKISRTSQRSQVSKLIGEKSGKTGPKGTGEATKWRACNWAIPLKPNTGYRKE